MPAQSLSLNAATDIDITQATARSGNKPERLRWFGDLALGLFIHWNVDVQLGVVISHSLVGASSRLCRALLHRAAPHLLPHPLRSR